MSTTAGNDREQAVKRRGWGFYASHIGPPGAPYMRRFIFRLPFKLGTVRLHQILRSDDDRHLHDHPFDFVSILLTGSYAETTPTPCDCDAESRGYHYRCDFEISPTRRRIWPRFSIVRKRAEDLHRLTLSRPLWTLVFAGPKRRDWGFATELGWVHNGKYSATFPESAGWGDVKNSSVRCRVCGDAIHPNNPSMRAAQLCSRQCAQSERGE